MVNRKKHGAGLAPPVARMLRPVNTSTRELLSSEDPGLSDKLDR